MILQKFLRANANDIPKAYSQLHDTLVWRKSFFSGASSESTKGWHDSKFAGMGYVSVLSLPNHEHTTVVSWNVYGATSNMKRTFGDLSEFIRWRVALMERSLQLMDLSSATTPIPDYGQGEDPYLGIQVHDYKGTSFLRMPGEVKAASKKTIELFARYYPETLGRKYFVNVPGFMG